MDTPSRPIVVLLATTSRDKLREIRDLLADAPITMLSLADLPPVPEPEETGTTFAANARLKAEYYDGHLRAPAATRVAGTGTLPATVITVAEDSGLEVDALGGDPGIRSARFVRSGAPYEERFAEIFRRLDARPDAPRTARYVCALSAVLDGRPVFDAEGRVEGTIASRAAGSGGFGYDPIFYYPPYGATFGEVSAEAKRRVSHRTRAFAAFVEWLRARDFRG